MHNSRFFPTHKPSGRLLGGSLLAVLILHGVAGYGLSQMQIKALKKPETPKPIAIKFINMVESPKAPVEVAPEPLPVAPTPVKQAQPTPKSVPTPTKRSAPPKATPEHKPKPKQKAEDTSSPHETQQQTKLPNSLSDNSSTSATLIKSNHSTSNQHATLSSDNSASGQKSSAGGGASNAGANDGNKKPSSGGTNAGNPGNNSKPASGGGDQVATITNANARWKAKPNLSVAEHLLTDSRVKNYNPSFRLSVNEKGRITSVSIASSTGSSELDRELVRRVRTGSLHPFTQNGVSVRGEGSVSLAIPKPRGARKEKDKEPKAKKDTVGQTQNSDGTKKSGAENSAPAADNAGADAGE